MPDEDKTTTDTLPAAPASQDTPAAAPESVSQTDAAQSTDDIVAAAKVEAGVTQPAPEVSTPAEGVPQGFLGLLKEAGIDHDYTDDAAAAKGFAELRKRLSERDQLAQIGQTVLPNYNDFQEYLKGKEAPKEPAAKDLPWNPPCEYNPSWLTEIAKEEDKRNPAVMQQYVGFMDYVQDKWQRWTTNPQSFVEEMVLPAIEGRMEKHQQELDTNRRVSQAIDANKDITEKYPDQISQMLQQNIPLEAAIHIMRQQDQINQYKLGKTPGAAAATTEQRSAVAAAASPADAAAAKAIPAAGVVVQTPAGAPKDTEEDIERYKSARECGLDALKAEGFNPIKPGSI